MAKLGKLEPVPLRTQWADEARDFTPWLASDEGIAMLGEALGLELEVEDTEVAVGSYRADIVAREAGSERRVVIENQLEPTNHDHIGKLITYSAAVEASTVVWVAEKIREEHRRAIDWLNDRTTEGLDFVAIEIELWKIAGSPPAPRIMIVARPDSFARAVRQGRTKRTETELTYLEFWEAFGDFLAQKKSKIARRKAQPQHWYDVAIGKTGGLIELTARARKKDLGVEMYLYGANAKGVFDRLSEERSEIEAALGVVTLEWMRLPNAKASRIIQRRSLDLATRADWPEAHAWLEERALAFRKVFAPRVKKLLDSLPPDAEAGSDENGEE